MYIGKDGSEIEVSEQMDQTYRALAVAAQRMADNATQALYAKYGDLSTMHPGAYAPTQAHRDVVAAMPMLLAGELSCEEAMALLSEYDVLRQRTGQKAKKYGKQ